MMATTNPLLKSVIVLLERKGRKAGAGIWRDASEALSSPSSRKVEVNVGHLSRLARDSSAVFVPGKVLGSGSLSRRLTVGAYSFSASAKRKIEESGGQVLTVQEFVKKYPKGSGVLLAK